MRYSGRAKAMTLAGLSCGFARAARAAGFVCNDGFGGATDFAASAVAGDFAAAYAMPGARHMIMCHPGFVDDELIRLDPVTDRRQREFEVLMRGDFPAPVWRPQRIATGDPIDWVSAWTGTGL